MRQVSSMTRTAWKLVTIATLMVTVASMAVADKRKQSREQTWDRGSWQAPTCEQPRTKPRAQGRPGGWGWEQSPPPHAPAWGRSGVQLPPNPRFGNPDFQAHLQQDLGLWGPPPAGHRPCPTVRGVPVPRSWGRDWWPANDWVEYVARHGVPPGQRGWDLPETPDAKWAQQVQGYRAWLINHPFGGSREWHLKHSHFLQYLEQNWYNYWFRLRYGQNPPNHTSHYFGWGFGREGW